TVLNCGQNACHATRSVTRCRLTVEVLAWRARTRPRQLHRPFQREHRMNAWTRREFLHASAAATAAAGAALVPGGLSNVPAGRRRPFQPSAAYELTTVLLDAAANDVVAHGARPTILSRAMGVTMTAMYDAWAAYDDRAVG